MKKGRCIRCVILVTVLLAGCVTGCGEKNVSAEQESSLEEDTAWQETESGPGEQENAQAQENSEKTGSVQESKEESGEQEQAYPADGADEYGFGPVSHDLSDIPPMENRLYAEWDGKIYYRQYSDEDREDGGLWADFRPIANSEKELMCMEPDGSVSQVGIDYGCGALFVVSDRVYSQKYVGLAHEDSYENSSYKVYSCKLDGSNVVEYSSAKVLDVKNGGIICQTVNEGLAFIDAQTGQERILTDENIHYLGADDEEIFYSYDLQREEDEAYDVTLLAMDYEGNRRELKTVSREEYIDCMGGDSDYGMKIHIPCFKIIEDDLYFSAGTYNGSANMYAGGPIYSMKRNGSGCKVEAVAGESHFYVYDDGGSRAIYYEKYSGSAALVKVQKIYGEIPQNIVLRYPYVSYDEPYVNSQPDSVLLYPDTSGICYVLLSAEECGELSILLYVDGSRRQAIEDIEYVNGRLFFTVTDLTYNREECIGWRDYYDRGSSACYCKDLENGEIRLLYEY